MNVLGNRSSNFSGPMIDNPEKFVVKLSSCTLHKMQSRAPVYGLKFYTHLKKMNSIAPQAQFEMFFSQLLKRKPSSADYIGWLKAK